MKRTVLQPTTKINQDPDNSQINNHDTHANLAITTATNYNTMPIKLKNQEKESNKTNCLNKLKK